MSINFIHTVRALSVVAATVLALQAVVTAAPGAGQYYQSTAWQDALVNRAFKDVLRREPTGSELRRYRILVMEEHWTEDDVRSDLRSRTDYRRYSSGASDVNPDQVIRRAYEDVLDRKPDAEDLRNYRRKMIDEGWTEQDVRSALRDSPEHRDASPASADRIVRRAYQDVLGRQPDFNGLVSYRNQVMHHGWDEHDVREALKRSPEYRQKNTLTRDQAMQIVNRAYRSVLGRDMDAAGAEGYIQKVLREHWSAADVARELRHSDEYRNKR